MNKTDDTNVKTGYGSRMKFTADGVKIKTLKLFIPKDAIRYQARKAQQLLHILDAQLLHHPEKVNIKDYLLALAEYSRLTEIIIKQEKINGTGKKAKKRMVSEALADDGGSEQEDVFSN